jgi:hypothetical protein
MSGQELNLDHGNMEGPGLYGLLPFFSSHNLDILTLQNDKILRKASRGSLGN